MAIDDQNTVMNVCYHPTPYPHAMRADLEEIAEVCDGIYLPFAEADLAYWSNKVKHCIDIAHEYNLLVVANFWGFANLFACGAIPSLFTTQHPEHNCVTNTGVPKAKSCPNKPAVRLFMKGAVEEFLDTYGADGVFWDEPNFALSNYLGALTEGEWLCRCGDCQARFKEQYGEAMPAERTAAVEQFQADTMLSFLSDLCGYVKAYGDHLITATCVMPSDSRTFREAVAKTENLDIYGIDPYWWPDNDVSQEEYITRYTRETIEIGRANGKLVEAWVAAWKQWAGHENLAYRAAKLIAGEDVDYINAWSYRDYVSWDPCTRENQADQEQVWQGLRRAYHEIRDGDREFHL
jgi:hypothetical protein